MPACPTSWTPARRWARCRSTSSRLHCDYLAGAARKFLRGPRGVGFLYVSDRALAAGAYPLTVDMHGADLDRAGRRSRSRPDARRFESWEIAYALVLGLGAAAEYALEVGDRGGSASGAGRWPATPASGWRRSTGVRVLDRGPALCAIATAELGGRPAEEVKLALRARGINTSSPAARRRRDRHGREGRRLRAADLAPLLQHRGRDRRRRWRRSRR